MNQFDPKNGENDFMLILIFTMFMIGGVLAGLEKLGII